MLTQLWIVVDRVCWPRKPSHLAVSHLKGTRRATKLIACIFPILAASGCNHLSGLDNTEAKAVYGYDVYDPGASAPKYYEAGLIRQSLILNGEFSISLRDAVFAAEGMGAGDLSAYVLDDQCFSEPIRIYPQRVSDKFSVRASLHSPLQYPAANGTSPATRLQAWMEKCDCDADREEVDGKCFGRRFAASVQEAYRMFLDAKNPGNPNSKAELTLDTLERLVRTAGEPFVPYDRLLIRERGLALPAGERDKAYMVQQIHAGEDLCFHSSTYSSTYPPNLAANASVAEPAAPACHPWLTVLRADYRNTPNATGTASIGTDPLSRVGPKWLYEDGEMTVGEQVVIKPSAAGTNKPERHRFLTSVDWITGRDINEKEDMPYRFALLFTKNVTFMIPNGPERDISILNKGDSNRTRPPLPKLVTRGSFLVLTRDLRLANFIRQKFSNNDTICSPLTSGDQVHDALVCLTEKWASQEPGIVFSEANVKDWMLDVALPSNVRPFVRFEVTIDGNAIPVRAGSTLVNIIDRRLGLSNQVFALRSRLDDANNAERANAIETQLITDAVKQITYARRSGVAYQTVSLRRAKRLEDLLIPVKAGDRVTWR